jgi:hypothetical protein
MELKAAKEPRLGDLVQYRDDMSPYVVIGVRPHNVEIEGDFSGVGHVQSQWVDAYSVKPFVYPDAPRWTLVKQDEWSELWQLVLNGVRITLLAKKHQEITFSCNDFGYGTYSTQTKDLEAAKRIAMTHLIVRMELGAKAVVKLKQAFQNALVSAQQLTTPTDASQRG